VPTSLSLERGSRLRHPSWPGPVPAPAPALRLGAGSVVRVADATGSKTWHARISYVNGEIFGLRGSVDVDRLFAARDMVTLHIGSDEVMLESQARVLAAGTRTLRVLVKRGVGALERRGSVRIQVPQLLSVRPVDHDASYAIVGQLLDLSLGGCALRTRQRLEVGTRVVVTTDAGCVPLQLIGEIVRVWRTGSSGWCHAGIQFDPMPPRARDTINRYFAEHLRRTSSS
jgi:hypothetical protein